MHAGTKPKGGMGVGHLPTWKIYHIAGPKWQCSVFLQGNLLDPSLPTEHIFAV